MLTADVNFALNRQLGRPFDKFLGQDGVLA